MYNLLYGNRLAVDPVRSVYNQADEPTSSSFNSTAKEAGQSLSCSSSRDPQQRHG